MGKDGMQWLGRCIDKNIVREGEKAFIRTLREHGKTFIIRRYNNKFRRYIEVLECGMGGRRERIVIPEGKQQNGWKGFNKELSLLVKPRNSKTQVQWDDGRGGGTEMGKNVDRGVGSGKSYRDVVYAGKCEAPKRETKPGETEKAKDITKVNLVTAGMAVEGVVEPNPGETVTAQSKERITPRQPLRFFPDAAPVNPRKLGRGIVIHINEVGQRRVTWADKCSTKAVKQWMPRDKNGEQKVESDVVDETSYYQAT